MNISLKLNDFQCTVNNKLTLIQACLKNRLDVPRFCFHERLSIAGNCRMCLVEDIKQVKPVASCAVNVTASMSVYTNTLKVKKARESVLEFLLANHPLDCPICDQGGECDLQDQSIVFGSDRGRFYEYKRAVEDKDCGPLIKTVMNRCIHCTRCVRFSVEVAGENLLGVTGRGSKMEIGFYVENLIRSELSGNIIDLCPVGALTSKPFSFTSRPWELRSFNSIDIFDNMHSNIRIDVRGTRIMRILPRVNDFINEDWITDKVRFSYDGFRRQRLHDPMVRLRNSFVKISWKKAFFLLKTLIIEHSSFSRKSLFPLVSYLGDHLDIETLYLVKKFSSLLGSNWLKSSASLNDSAQFYTCRTPLTSLFEADLCVIFGLNLRLQLPLINSKLRQLSLKNNTPIYVFGYFSAFNYYVKHISTSTNAVLNFLEGSHWLSSKISKTSSGKPLIFVSDDLGDLCAKLITNSSSYTNVLGFGWEGLNVISSRSSFFAINELGFPINPIPTTLNYSFNWLFNYDRGFSSPSFNIYQGHHGDRNASLSDLILPATSFIEKNSFYVNMWGMVQKTKRVLFSPGNSRDDWKILNAFIEFAGFRLKIKNTLDLTSLISKSTPFVLYIATPLWFRSCNNLVIFYFKNFFSLYNNYYISDVISRNSKVMSLCSAKFKLGGYNFLNFRNSA